MKNIIYIALLVSIFSCEKGHRTDCFKATGEIITERRMLSFFDGILIGSRFDIVLIDSSENFIEITAGKNLLDGITTVVENNILTVRNKNVCNFVRKYDVPFELRIYGKINTIWHQSDGLLTNSNDFSSDIITLHLEGSEAKLRLNNKKFVADMFQTGSITLTGKCNEINIDLTSFGSFHGEDLNCKKATVSNKGEGDLFVNSSDTLNASVFSVGNIFYSGNPKVIQKEFLGKGKIIEQ